MSTEKVTEVKKEAIEKDVHSQPIENQGILEEVAHIGGRLAGAAKNTAVAAKDAVVHAGEFTKEKAIAAKDYVMGDTHHDSAVGQPHPDWFRDTGVDKKEIMEERNVVLGKHPSSEGLHSNLDQAFTTEKKDVQDITRDKDVLGGGVGKRDFATGLGDTALDKRDSLGAFFETGQLENEKRLPAFDSGLPDAAHDWFHDTGVDKGEVMKERQTVLGDKAGLDKDIAKRSEFGQDRGIDKDFEKREGGIDKDFEKREGGIDKDFEKREGERDSAHDWFHDTGVDKREVMEERRAVLGERTDISKDRFDNTSNTLANKAGQLKDTVSTKAGQMKDSALEKGGQLKDAALEKGGQLKAAALEKGGQLKDAAADKAYHLKESAIDKGYQLKESALTTGQQAKDSALEKGDQLKGAAIDAGHAVQEKGIAMKAAHDKGFVQQEQRVDKENARF